MAQAARRWQRDLFAWFEAEGFTRCGAAVAAAIGDRVPVEENLPSHRRRCVDTRPATQVLRVAAYCCRIYL